MRLKQIEYTLIAERGSTPFLSYSRSSGILHIYYGESFLVPAGAWLCGSLTARARRSPMRVRLPSAHFARRSGKNYLSFGYFLLVGRSFKRKDGISPCRFDSYAPTRNCEVWLGFTVTGYKLKACILRFVSSVGRTHGCKAWSPLVRVQYRAF